MNIGNREKLKNLFKRPFGDDSDPVDYEIIVVSPYISRDALEDALSPLEGRGEYSQVTIICSWRTSDLVSGASDIGVYETCREKGWKLRVNSDRSTRKIHLKAYLAQRPSLGGTFEGRGMIGSANLTNSGLDSNIEYLHPVSTGLIDLTDETRIAHYTDWLPGSQKGTGLGQALQQAFLHSQAVDDEAYESMKSHLEDIGPMERAKLPNWEPPEPVADLSDLAEYILNKMPRRPSLRDIMQVESIDRALNIRGLRFGETRALLRDKLPKDTTREDLNQKTNQAIQEIVQSNSDFDIQKRYGTDCLVWKVHPILNEEIMSNLKPHLGKPIRELGLDEELWDSDTLGSKPVKISEVCTKLLPSEIVECVKRLSTWQGTLRLTNDDKALYPRPYGERLQFTTNDGELLRNVAPSIEIGSLLPETRIREELWMPAFCLFEAPKGALLGDAILRGFGVWESGRDFVASMERDFDSDIEVLSEQSTPFFDNPFRKQSETEVTHTKVAAQGGKTGFPLGHPERPMSRYLNTSSLTDIAREILSHDH
jgi:hypothetical protein